MSELDAGILGDVVRLRRGRRTGRLSSWDQSGRNQDCWMVGPGEEITLADLEGPGRLTHIWMTQASKVLLGPSMVTPDLAGVGNLGVDPVMGIHWEQMDPDFYRKVVLKIYWDDQTQPSVLAPIGDFFGLMNSLSGNLDSLPLCVVAEDSEVHRFGGAAALSSFFQMPFNRRARVVLENQSDRPYLQYFYIDYELQDRPFPEDVAYFHAHWRRSAPTTGWAPDLQVNSPETNVPNLTGAENYVVLDVQGEGHYVGCVLAVVHHQGTYPGEGDDMVFVDGETWPPRYHGTGLEDYFGHAWQMQHRQSWHGGSIVHTDDVPGFQHSYRFHLTDPIRFSRSIRVTIEHGHANHLADDWSSVAYWYQALPSPTLRIADLPHRLPPRPVLPAPAYQPPDTPALRHATAARDDRMARYMRDRDELVRRRIADTRDWEIGNLRQARRQRKLLPILDTGQGPQGETP